MSTRFKPAREHFAPKGAVRIKPKDVEALVFVYESKGAPCAMAFGGKRNRPDFHIRFRTPQRREQHVREWLDNLRSVKAMKDERDAKRRGFRHGYKIGDILHHSWGYDQTNCEFYQVVAATPGTVTIRELQQRAVPGSMISHGMAEQRVAIPGKFLDKSERITKRVQYAETGPGYVPMKHGSASLWDGRPKYCSWYA